MVETTQEFLDKKIYLPGYMILGSAAYQGNKADFDFNLAEPKLTVMPYYLTPRGVDLCVVQASYAIIENLTEQGRFDFDLSKLREIALDGRIRLVELNQKLRRELRLGETVQGRLNLTKFRYGRMPIAKFDFDIGNKAVHGNLVAVIATERVAQRNQDMLRH